jgi:hypothetical protein
VKVHVLAQTIAYPEGGGHFWVYLNWALGLRASGAEVTWVESVDPKLSPAQVEAGVERLRLFLSGYGFDRSIALLSLRPGDVPPALAALELTADRAREADLFLNFRYGLEERLLAMFRRTALIDIDPGLLQVWVGGGQMAFSKHDVYFTTGQGVGRPGGIVPDLGLVWHSIPPCVALEAWPVAPVTPDAPFTTVSHWQAEEYVVEASGYWYPNDKRSGFLPFFDLPGRVARPLELALCIGSQESEEQRMLEGKGWRIAHAYDVAGTPADYHRYIQSSYGEFSAAKPSSVRFAVGWTSDRTLCYLASGKPAVVQHTGLNTLLPDAAGIWRVRDLDEAAQAIEAVAADYPNQCRLARQLAEEAFDARKIASRVLEIALP